MCIVSTCENEVHEGRNYCITHLRRSIQGHVYEDEDGELRDHCAEGHSFSEENTRWESSGRGRKRRRCRQCGRDKARRLAARKAEAPAEVPRAYRPEDPTLRQAIYDFDEARALVAGNCLGKEEKYIDWAFDNDLPVPTAQEARELCEGCPLRQVCNNYRIAAREQYGVWGGVAVMDGEVIAD